MQAMYVLCVRETIWSPPYVLSSKNELQVLYYHSKSAQPTGVAPVGDYEEKYNAPWYYFHRVDLHGQLRDMALSDPKAGSHKKKTTIRLRSTVKDIELDGTITLQDNTVIKKDLVVVADGIRVGQGRLLLGISS